MADQLDMHHPVTGGEGKTTQQQFSEVWESRGWLLGRLPAEDATAAEVPADASPEPAKPAKRGSEPRSA